MAGLDKIDPANPCYRYSAARAPRVGRPAHMAGRVSSVVKKCRARERFEGIPVVGEYALQRRAAVAGKVRVLTP
ncbi:MAG: hypothetical protein JWP51_5039 [Bradyrhizobium sp.]|jgi:hypothetical protein|nr:hypothetical protein [Bradyrhizobium sp.]